MRTDTGVVVEGQGRGGGETPKAVKLTRSWPAQGGARSIWAQGSPAGGPYVSCDSPQILHGPGPRMETAWGQSEGLGPRAGGGGRHSGGPPPCSAHGRTHPPPQHREAARETERGERMAWRRQRDRSGEGCWVERPSLAGSEPMATFPAPLGSRALPVALSWGTQTAVNVPRGAAGGWDIRLTK